MRKYPLLLTFAGLAAQSFLNGRIITGDTECALNYEKMSVESAIVKLKDCQIPRNHELKWMALGKPLDSPI